MFKREDRTVNNADPTQLLTWESKHIRLQEFWGVVEATVTIGRRKWVTRNHPLFVRLFNFLESRYRDPREEDEYFGLYGANE